MGRAVILVEGGPLVGGALLHSDVEVAEVKTGLLTRCFKDFQEQSFLKETFGLDFAFVTLQMFYVHIKDTTH